MHLLYIFILIFANPFVKYSLKVISTFVCFYNQKNIMTDSILLIISKKFVFFW